MLSVAQGQAGALRGNLLPFIDSPHVRCTVLSQLSRQKSMSHSKIRCRLVEFPWIFVTQSTRTTEKEKGASAGAGLLFEREHIYYKNEAPKYEAKWWWKLTHLHLQLQWKRSIPAPDTLAVPQHSPWTHYTLAANRQVRRTAALPESRCCLPTSRGEKVLL